MVTLAACVLRLAAAGTSNGFLFGDTPFFGFGDEPAFLAHGTEHAAVADGLAEAAEYALLGFAIS